MDLVHPKISRIISNCGSLPASIEDCFLQNWEFLINHMMCWAAHGHFLSCSTVWFLRALLFCRRLFIPFQSVSHGKAELKAHVNTMTWSASTVKSGVALLYDLWFVSPLVYCSLLPFHPFVYPPIIATRTTFSWFCCTVSVAMTSWLLPSCETCQWPEKGKNWKNLQCSQL